MPQSDDFIMNILNEAEEESTDISNDDSSDVEFKRDENGNLVSYDKNTGEKIGEVFEHGVSKSVSKTFNEIVGME